MRRYLIERFLQPGILGDIQFIATESLLGKRISVQVKAVLLPEPRLFLLDEFKPAQPLRALPEIPPRHHQPQWPAMLRAQRLAGVVGGQQTVGV